MPKYLVRLSSVELFVVPVIAPDIVVAETRAREIILDANYPVDDTYIMLTENPFHDDELNPTEVDDKTFAAFAGPGA